MKTSKFLGLVTLMTVLGTTTMFGSNFKNDKGNNSKSQTNGFVVKQNNGNFNSGRNDDKTCKELVNMQNQDKKQNVNSCKNDCKSQKTQCGKDSKKGNGCNCSKCKKHKKQTSKCNCNSCKKQNNSKQTVVCGRR